MDPLEWADMCSQTVVWQPLLSRDGFGKPNWGTAQTFIGRRENKLTRVPNTGMRGSLPGQGPDVIAQAVIWILADVDIKYDDAVYIQGDGQPYPRILTIQRTPDEEGPLFTKVFMGNAV